MPFVWTLLCGEWWYCFVVVSSWSMIARYQRPGTPDPMVEVATTRGAISNQNADSRLV